MKFMHVSFEAVSRITPQDQYFSAAMPAAVSFAAVECSTHNLHNHSVENVKRYKDYQTFTLITQPCLLWKLLVPRLLKHIFVWHAIELNKQEYTRQEIWIYYYPVIVNMKYEANLNFSWTKYLLWCWNAMEGKSPAHQQSLSWPVIQVFAPCLDHQRNWYSVT